MEYVGFTIFIAASGAIIFWFLNKIMISRNTAEAGKARQLKSGLSGPPVKRTISGPMPEDLEYMGFVNRTDIWDMDREVRPEKIPRSVGPVSGTPYTPAERRAAR